MSQTMVSLTVVCCFSRWCWAVPIVDKTHDTIAVPMVLVLVLMISLVPFLLFVIELVLLHPEFLGRCRSEPGRARFKVVRRDDARTSRVVRLDVRDHARLVVQGLVDAVLFGVPPRPLGPPKQQLGVGGRVQQTGKPPRDMRHVREQPFELTYEFRL